jgi:hypothetical protein
MKWHLPFLIRKMLCEKMKSRLRDLLPVRKSSCLSREEDAQIGWEATSVWRDGKRVLERKVGSGHQIRRGYTS